jgi:hypothetical protein
MIASAGAMFTPVTIGTKRDNTGLLLLRAPARFW